MNYVLALTLIITLFACFGRPVYEVVIGETDETKIESVEETAWQSGDVILKIDGRNVYMITDYMDVLAGRQQGESVNVLVLRGGAEQTISVTLLENADFVNMSDTSTLLGALGIDGLYTTTVRHGAIEVVGRSFAYSWRIGGMVLRSLGELLTGKIGLDSMGGPVTTITVTAQAASSGMLQFLNIAALIGVNLAVFNLLPIPALDGSKVVFCLIEWIRKKPINRNVEAIIHFIGIIVLFGFAILVDILQLF
jgi:regulator of sigma E protease